MNEKLANTNRVAIVLTSIITVGGIIISGESGVSYTDNMIAAALVGAFCIATFVCVFLAQKKQSLALARLALVFSVSPIFLPLVVGIGFQVLTLFQ